MNKHLYKTNVALLLERIEYLEDRLKLNNAGPGGCDEYDMNAINYLLKFADTPDQDVMIDPVSDDPDKCEYNQ